MALIIAQKLFGYRPQAPDRIWLDALSIFQTERRAVGRAEISSAQRRRKRSLGVLHMNPDMAAIRCMRAVRQHLLDEYGVWYDGRHNKFKDGFDEYRSSKLLGFMETVTAVFTRRNVELDMVLKNHNKKEIKVSHAIRDCGTFDPSAYEAGRDEAYRVIVLALPQRRPFCLLEGSPVVADQGAA